MTEPAITPELVAQHDLTPDEYQKIFSLPRNFGGRRVADCVSRQIALKIRRELS
ncbi:MAG: hypothetical protein KGJ60_13750 [Verrucomicrobiota bacterium]|nr:hypothetical protein [Verrucomicrobiota bacterium]